MADLSDLIAQMREAERNGDTEGAHADADEILCQAVRRLGGPEGAELVTLYEGVDKWYA